MKETRAFLAGRSPPAPAALRGWLEALPLDGAPPVEVLTREGLGALDRARAAPGRVRNSAFHLLAADALITHACEAALEADDPVGTLDALLRKAGGPR